ncbi:hypothetical protein RclHR1_10410005 [Rhizophagus clarus]|uniref:Kinase-like domain-containing protein n=1 Tax=Rhizophagus clarus TaxID=94130 RepID=A0A2Z6Q2J6_9GLOM|nr:hypothetical protein RclHR1_10410005 [Rhizophagus clarus]GET02548.1 kinase-like domain-containing protein [Rhizophagus clarus]
MGLCKPADYNESEVTKNGIFGVLPYIAPEIIKCKHYTSAADIYSFGIIMYEIISGLPPYPNATHDQFLAMNICNGRRPVFNNNTPQLIVQLINRCLDANPLKRPTALEICKILRGWARELSEPSKPDQTGLIKQIREAEESNNKSSVSYETYSEVIHTSKWFKFDNLPEPKNSDDNNSKYSEFLQFDFTVDS